MYNLLRINVLMNIFRKLLSSAVFSCSLIVIKSLMVRCCEKHVVPPDLPPEGGRVLVRISQKTYFQGVPAPKIGF